jgi:polar amino acid transport system substrate-binding protein
VFEKILRGRFGRVGLVALLVLMLAGCSTLGLRSSGTDRVKRTGQLRVGMAGNYPPMNARTVDGRLIGLDADLAGALAAILGLELVLVEKPIGELIDAVQDGEVDLAISGLTMNPIRNLDVAFAGPYYVARKAMWGRSDVLLEVDQVSQLKGRGLRIAAVRGGTSETLVRRALPTSTHLFVESQDEAVALVLDGRADVLVADDPVIRFAMLRHPDAGFMYVESKNSAEPIGIAIAPEDHLFVNLIENYLANLEQIGLLDRLRVRWLEGTDWLDQLP